MAQLVEVESERANKMAKKELRLAKKALQLQEESNGLQGNLVSILGNHYGNLLLINRSSFLKSLLSHKVYCLCTQGMKFYLAVRACV